ncbi:MurR/RpiR family transcriptional regulator [Phenylobacterium sp. LjRoot225]|uniref:MurR/RpiR family transcriptional regulator n=1 Tax=Phenylobacterium sp. LjRoot225 TaxID=3342285 RepID=UPI003ECCCA28
MKNEETTSRGTSVRELLTEAETTLTPSELKIIQVLLADYPSAGLGSASALARRAGVSDPTVGRLANKLGFDSFTALQARLLEEVEERLRSPLMMMLETPSAGREGNKVTNYLMSVTRRMRDATEAAVVEPYERAADLIMNARGRVHILGGRFSRHVGGMLAGYLSQFRPGVELIAPLTSESVDALLDMGRKDVLIVFDYRRYQTDVIDFARQAVARGARVILFTDPWLSPIAEVADAVFIASVEVDSPYDSLAPAVAQMEALVAHVVGRDKDVFEHRIAELEALRSHNAVTVDAPGPFDTSSSSTPKKP